MPPSTRRVTNSSARREPLRGRSAPDHMLPLGNPHAQHGSREDTPPTRRRRPHAAIGGLLTLLVMRTEKSAGTVRQEQTERAEPGEQVGV